MRHNNHIKAEVLIENGVATFDTGYAKGPIFYSNQTGITPAILMDDPNKDIANLVLSHHQRLLDHSGADIVAAIQGLALEPAHSYVDAFEDFNITLDLNITYSDSGKAEEMKGIRYLATNVSLFERQGFKGKQSLFLDYNLELID